MPDAADALALAERLRRDGRRADADKLLRGLASADPGCAAAAHLLGRLAYEEGRAADAAAWFGRAARAEPAAPLYRSCLGAACKPPASSARRRPSTGGPWS